MLPEEEFASVQEQFKNEVAGLGALRTPEGLLPLKAVRLEATLVGFSSLWVLQQTFQNTSQTSLEAIYIFPLPERGAVQKFEMRIGERVIQGTLLERASARLKYRNALEKGHQAAITEEERPGVFTIRVGNLPAGKEVQVHLEVAQPLPCIDQEVTFRFPLVVAPGYVPGKPISRPPVGSGVASDTHAVPDASRITPPVLLPGFPNPIALQILMKFSHNHLFPVNIRS